jgi:L-alanine-DL-glutamate epimerase-like enolase superfamily enzyme
MRLDAERRTLHLATPLQSSYGAVHDRELVVVTLTGEDGSVGYGEAAPLEAYDGVSTERVQRVLESYRPVLARSTDMNGAQVIEACRGVEDLPAALSAIDLALWDRAGRRAGKPVAELLSDDPVTHVPVNATLSALDRAGAAEQAAAAVQAGFQCLKLKVGIGDDAGRVAATRAAAGPQVALRLDANGAWSVSEAVAAIETLSPAGLELVEEPTHGLHAMREVREQVAVRVSIDETAGEHGALTAGVADAICLKISRCGGSARLAWPRGTLWSGDARAVRGSREPAAGAPGRDRTAHLSWPRGRAVLARQMRPAPTSCVTLMGWARASFRAARGSCRRSACWRSSRWQPEWRSQRS